VHFRQDFAVLATNPAISKPLETTRTRSTTGASIAAVDRGAVVIDSETGTLSLLDEESKIKDSIKIASVAGLLAVDRTNKKIFIADRNADKIVVVAYGNKLQKIGAFETRTEPYGLALTPDGKTLLVTTVAGKSLQPRARSSVGPSRLALEPAQLPSRPTAPKRSSPFSAPGPSLG
jgi:DNA-binding beta-propeller fold protein YncE